jgi:hypothetical protein
MKPLSLLLGLGLLAGCTASPARPPGGGAAATAVNVPGTGGPSAARVTATARLDVRGLGDRYVLAVVGWTHNDIDHVQLALFPSGATTAESTFTVAKADLGSQVTLTNLNTSTTYRVVAKAWSDAAGTSEIDNVAVDASSCTTEFTTGTGATNDVGTLKLKLADRVFEGSTGGKSFAITDGANQDTGATITATLN